MPWKVINQMDLKYQLVTAHVKEQLSITDLSQKYGISRPTVYKWLRRYEQSGLEGLKEQSRAPKNCPHRTPEHIRELLIATKLNKRKDGPRKIRTRVQRQNPGLNLPVPSTIGYWFKKEGLVEQRKKRRHVPPYSQPFGECTAPNDVWSIDYKGQFYMQNRRVCYPLTASDNFSRFILGCRALAGPRYTPTRRSLEDIFREYGLPDAIRFDNGTPFASRCIGGLSRLMVWLVLLGITPERIAKGCPQQNGRHERMHRTLKRDALDPVGRNLKEQQKAFDVFRHEFNNDRPHESLNDQTPSEWYKKSSRPYVEHPHPPEYAHGYLVRCVRQSGEIKFAGTMFYLTESLAGLPVGLKEIADGLWQLKFSFYALGTVDLRKNKIIRT